MAREGAGTRGGPAVTSASVAAGLGVDHYRQQLDDLSRRHSEPAWLRERRRAAFERFADRGFPTARDEAWRQTRVARIAAINFVRPSSSIAPSVSRDETAAGVEVWGLRQLLEKAPDRLEAHLAAVSDETASAFADLNTALHEDGVVVFLAPGAVITEPIHIGFASAGAPAALQP